MSAQAGSTEKGGSVSVMFFHLDAQPHHLRFHDCFVTAGADGMAELRLGMIHHVGLDLLPIVAVIPDLLAIAADRQQSGELLHALERALELHNVLGEGTLQSDHLGADPHARQQFGPVERLHHIIIRACPQAFDHIGLGIARGEQR